MPFFWRTGIVASLLWKRADPGGSGFSGGPALQEVGPPHSWQHVAHSPTPGFCLVPTPYRRHAGDPCRPGKLCVGGPFGEILHTLPRLPPAWGFRRRTVQQEARRGPSARYPDPPSPRRQPLWVWFASRGQGFNSHSFDSSLADARATLKECRYEIYNTERNRARRGAAVNKLTGEPRHM